MDSSTVEHLLTTTRCVRRRLDLSRPVESEVLERCIEIATQAPIGGNLPKYHFVVVTDPDIREKVAALYRKSVFEMYVPARRKQEPVFPEGEAGFFASLQYLAERLHEVPTIVIPCIEGRPEKEWLETTLAGE